MNFSLTITGLLTLILSQFTPIEELEVVLEAVGIIMTWYGRYRAGGINVFGLKK